jgi:hypothetical protein
MGTFESIVRPFQSQAITPPRRVLSTKKVDEQNIVLELGKSGQGTTFGYSYSVDMATYYDKKHSETKRKEVKKKIRDRDDPSQFIEAKDTRKLKARGAIGKYNYVTNFSFKETKDDETFTPADPPVPLTP